MRWKASAMLRSSPGRFLEAIVTQASALIVALADLKALRNEAAQSTHQTAMQSRHHACEVGSFLARELAR